MLSIRKFDIEISDNFLEASQLLLMVNYIEGLAQLISTYI